MTFDHYSPDIMLLLRLLHEHRVKYLVIGGEAVIHHGYARLTSDIDLFFQQTPLNVERLFEALREFWGGPVPAVDEAADLLSPRVVVQFGRPPNRVDFISGVGTVDFDKAWRHRDVDRARQGRLAFPIHFIGLGELLQSKRDAGRHKDLDDIEHLEALRPTRARARKKKKRKKT